MIIEADTKRNQITCTHTWKKILKLKKKYITQGIIKQKEKNKLVNKTKN